jgi:SSS family solute:Na+ symporter
MQLTWLDWSAIVGYLLITILMGLYFRSRSGSSMEEYFVSGRSVSWWLAGTSMVATTFSADTPLLVTGIVYTQGIAGNWLWWSFLLSGMMTVFLFARLWRRSGLLTDVQFAEMRYSGKPAAFLRGFRAVYIGLLMNCLILGWVTKAMISIVGVVMGVSEHTALAICIFIIVPFTGLYVAIGGLWGVLWTDLFQFVLKMGVVIAVAYYGISAVGGMHELLRKLQIAQPPNPAIPHGNPINFFPNFSAGLTAQDWWTLPVITLLVFLGLQWWAFWYPGAEPGGGGYIAQRIFSAKDERQGLLSVLWFNIAHYALRPWPWILTGLVVIVLYPHLDPSIPGQHPEDGYMLVLTHYLPASLRGLAVAGFLAAFMSTIATQLNWGASYLVADFYKRFIKPEGSQRHYVVASRLVTVFLVVCAAFVAAQLASIQAGWQWVLELSAGTGAVYLLRWYWWRINAWSEIAAMIVALVVSVALRFTHPFSGNDAVLFAKTAGTTTLITTLAWIAATYLTRPVSQEVLVSFYRHVRPDVRGWKHIAAIVKEVKPTRDLGRNLGLWVLGCSMVYSFLFGSGYAILGQSLKGTLLLVIGVVCLVVLLQQLRSFVAEPERERHVETAAFLGH